MPTQREKLQTMADIAQKGEVAILEKVFELQDALAEAKARLEAIQGEQERDKRMVVEVDQPPVDLTPVIEALQDLKTSLPTIPESKEVDMSPVVDALRDLQNTVALDNQYPESKDYTEHFTTLIEALNRPTREQDIIDALSRPYPEFQIPKGLISSEGRIKVEVDKVGGNGSSRVADIRGVAVNPATSERQDSIITALTQQYTLLIDDEYPVTYIGEAVPGTATSVGEWRIKKIDETTSDTTIKYAGGGAFSQVWDNRASLTYA